MRKELGEQQVAGPPCTIAPKLHCLPARLTAGTLSLVCGYDEQYLPSSQIIQPHSCLSLFLCGFHFLMLFAFHMSSCTVLTLPRYNSLAPGTLAAPYLRPHQLFPSAAYTIEQYVHTI